MKKALVIFFCFVAQICYAGNQGDSFVSIEVATQDPALKQFRESVAIIPFGAGYEYLKDELESGYCWCRREVSVEEYISAFKKFFPPAKLCSPALECALSEGIVTRRHKSSPVIETLNDYASTPPHYRGKFMGLFEELAPEKLHPRYYSHVASFLERCFTYFGEKKPPVTANEARRQIKYVVGVANQVIPAECMESYGRHRQPRYFAYPPADIYGFFFNEHIAGRDLSSFVKEIKDLGPSPQARASFMESGGEGCKYLDWSCVVETLSSVSKEGRQTFLYHLNRFWPQNPQEDEIPFKARILAYMHNSERTRDIDFHQPPHIDFVNAVFALLPDIPLSDPSCLLRPEAIVSYRHYVFSVYFAKKRGFEPNEFVEFVEKYCAENGMKDLRKDARSPAWPELIYKLASEGE